MIIVKIFLKLQHFLQFLVINDFLTNNLTKNSSNSPLDPIKNFLYYQPSNKSIIFNQTQINTAPIINFNISSYLLGLSDDQLISVSKVSLNLNIKNVVDNSKGKWPSSLGNVIAIDSSFGSSYIINILSQILKSSLIR